MLSIPFVFASIAENLVSNDTNFFSDVLVRDRTTDTIERVSHYRVGNVNASAPTRRTLRRKLHPDTAPA